MLSVLSPRYKHQSLELILSMRLETKAKKVKGKTNYKLQTPTISILEAEVGIMRETEKAHRFNVIISLWIVEKQ